MSSSSFAVQNDDFMTSVHSQSASENSSPVLVQDEFLCPRSQQILHQQVHFNSYSPLVKKQIAESLTEEELQVLCAPQLRRFEAQLESKFKHKLNSEVNNMIEKERSKTNQNINVNQREFKSKIVQIQAQKEREVSRIRAELARTKNVELELTKVNEMHETLAIKNKLDRIRKEKMREQFKQVQSIQAQLNSHNQTKNNTQNTEPIRQNSYTKQLLLQDSLEKHKFEEKHKMIKNYCSPIAPELRDLILLWDLNETAYASRNQFVLQLEQVKDKIQEIKKEAKKQYAIDQKVGWLIQLIKRREESKNKGHVDKVITEKVIQGLREAPLVEYRGILYQNIMDEERVM
ncbi:Hypothetical_protein [Hexamita inflata]|uniref:Hypothetical_protein n=1 Tax=Hexamita inflata TaxID=28002 RepID=A0AA86R3J4_9EUKA|nr:Hypothetical protein HINF_LOCUS54041 [Hexamita inflata]